MIGEFFAYKKKKEKTKPQNKRPDEFLLKEKLCSIKIVYCR